MPKILDFTSFKTGKLQRSRLRGRFIVAKLADTPSYEALSYAWGEPVFDDEIELPEGVFPITSHLGLALRHLRRKSGRRRLWVDAICIDQSDGSKEKGPQVSLMARIYRNTEECLVWLGTSSLTSDISIDLLAQLARTSSNHGFGLETIPQTFARPGRLPHDLVAALDKLARITAGKLSQLTMNEHLSCFFGQSWFQRLWIVQEMALPLKLTLQNGEKKLDGLEFLLGTLVLNYLSKQDSYFRQMDPSNLRTAANLCLVRLVTQNIEDPCLEPVILELVAKNSERICREPKDRIYALVGIQSSRDITQITPNYDASDEDAFRQFAIDHLLGGDLRCLCYAGLVRHTCKKRALPTWVPDWTCNDTRIRVRIGHSFGISYEACRMGKKDIAFDEKDAAVIRIRGVLLDVVNMDVSGEPESVDGIASHLRNHADARQQFAMILRWSDLCNVNHKGTEYYNGEEVQSVVARTLVLNDHSHVTCRISNMDSSPGAGDGMAQWLRRLICIERHLSPCKISQCAMLPSQETVTQVLELVEAVGHGRSLFTTKSGYIGLGPVSLEPGDAIVFFHGAETPFLLRKVCLDKGKGNARSCTADDGSRSAERWQLVGDCYLHGFMNNEILRPDYKGKHRLFWLV